MGWRNLRKGDFPAIVIGNKRMEPKEFPSSLIPRLLNTHTQKLEIFVIGPLSVVHPQKADPNQMSSTR